ncbi:hypothetical protein FQR65_LT15591 [Abscondita terminalis]|nr:hypothetical protein FQR65_LT15591 [Abscondita terminalis]
MSMTTRSMSKKQDKEIDDTMEEENEEIQETMEGESVKTTEVEETPVISQFDFKMLIEVMKKNTEEIKKSMDGINNKFDDIKNENKANMDRINKRFDGMNDKIDQMNETPKKQFEEQLMVNKVEIKTEIQRIEEDEANKTRGRFHISMIYDYPIKQNIEHPENEINILQQSEERIMVSRLKMKSEDMLEKRLKQIKENTYTAQDHKKTKKYNNEKAKNENNGKIETKGLIIEQIWKELDKIKVLENDIEKNEGDSEWLKNENRANMDGINKRFDEMNDKIDQMNETLKKQFEEQLMVNKVEIKTEIQRIEEDVNEFKNITGHKFEVLEDIVENNSKNMQERFYDQEANKTRGRFHISMIYDYPIKENIEHPENEINILQQSEERIMVSRLKMKSEDMLEKRLKQIKENTYTAQDHKKTKKYNNEKAKNENNGKIETKGLIIEQIWKELDKIKVLENDIEKNEGDSEYEDKRRKKRRTHSEEDGIKCKLK